MPTQMSHAETLTSDFTLRDAIDATIESYGDRWLIVHFVVYRDQAVFLLQERAL